MRSHSLVIELRHLRHFVAVAENLSFHRAAAQLNLSEQQVSQTVRDLESIIEVRLLDRTTRTVALTQAGATLLRQANKLFDQLDLIVSDTQLAARGETGRIVIGIAGGTAESWLPKVFSTFRKRFPRVYLDVRLLSSGEQINAVMRGEIDAGFAISPLPRAGLCIDSLCQTGFVLQVPSSLYARMHTKRHLSDYRNQPFIELLSSVTPGFAARCQLLFAEAEFTPRTVQYADNRQTIMTLVSAGMGVSVAPALIQGSQRIGVKHIPLISSINVELTMIYKAGEQKQALASLLAIAKSIFSAHTLRYSLILGSEPSSSSLCEC